MLLVGQCANVKPIFSVSETIIHQSSSLMSLQLHDVMIYFRISKDESLEENQNNLIKLAQEFINKITSSSNRYEIHIRIKYCDYDTVLSLIKSLIACLFQFTISTT